MQIDLKSFRDALTRCKPAVSSRTTLPALNSIKLNAVTDCCHFLTSDSDQWIDTFCPGKVAKPWCLCVSHERLERAAKFWVADMVKLTPNEAGTAILFECGAYRLPLPALSGVEMPEPPKSEGEPEAVKDFGTHLRRLAPFCSDDPSRGPLLGVHLGPNFMEAANGISLVRIGVEMSGGGFLFPASAIPSVPAGDAVLHVGESVMAVSSGDTTLTTKRIEGQFPNTTPVLERGGERHPVTCWRQELLSAVDYCEGQSKGGKWTNLWLDITAKSLRVSLSRADIEGDSPVKELPCRSETELRVALSAPRLSALLKAFSGDEITLGFGGKMDPLFIEQNGCTAVQLLSRIDA